MALPESPGRGQPRPALRLVETKSLSREDWLSVRKHGIGGSDAAAAVGLSPYMSPLELWLIKTGRDANLPKPDPGDTTEPVYWGTLLEPIVAASYTKQTGNRDVQLLECKTAGEFGARLWRDGVPEYVQLQVQHQLAVTGKSSADVAVLICGQKLEVHRIERDDGIIARLMELEAAFWRHVETDTPPAADGSESADRALRCLYPGAGGTVDFTDDRRLSSVFSDLVAVRAEIESRQSIEAKLKQTIQQAMGEAGLAQFETGSVSYRRSKDGTGIDLKRLLADQPELTVQYTFTKPGSRRFLVNT